MEWKWKCLKINEETIKYHSFAENNNELTYADCINLFKKKDRSFLESFRQTLNDATEKLSAYFWECVPVSKKTINKPFEFVVTKSEELNNVKQNSSGFEEYLAKVNDVNEPDVIAFSNLTNDAILVIPALKSKKVEGGAEMFDYKNLSQFTKNAPFEQQKDFWQEVANQLTKALEESNNPKWLSTHGLGIAYLHVRIDNKPKYYSHEEYKHLTAPSSENAQKTAPDNQKIDNHSTIQKESSKNAKLFLPTDELDSSYLDISNKKIPKKVSYLPWVIVSIILMIIAIASYAIWKKIKK